MLPFMAIVRYTGRRQIKDVKIFASRCLHGVKLAAALPIGRRIWLQDYPMVAASVEWIWLPLIQHRHKRQFLGDIEAK